MIKTLHLACVYLSIAGFIVRGIWFLQGSPLFKHKLTKIVPHIVDTLLLISGVTLAIQLHAFSQPWLITKLVALAAYIGLGISAFRLAKTKALQTSSWIAAIVVYAYLMAVAITKNPMLF